MPSSSSSEATVLVCLAAMEASWLVPWAFILAPEDAGLPLLPVAVACAVLALAVSTAAWFRRGAFREGGWQLGSAVVAILVAVIASAFAPNDQGPSTLPAEAATVLRDGFAPALLGFLFSLLLWVRGSSVGVTKAGDRRVTGRAILGVLSLSGAALAASASAPRSEVVVAPAAALFLVALLLSSALDGLEYVRTTARARAAGGFGRSWLTLSSSLAIAILVIGLLAASLAEARGLQIIGAVLAPLVLLLELAILALSIPAALLMALIARLVGPIAGRGLRPLPPLLQPLARPPTPSPQAAVPPPQLLNAGSLLLAAVVVGVLLMSLLIALRRRASEHSDGGIPEERQSVWSWDQLADAIRSVRRRRRATGLPRVDGVRQAYRAYQEVAAARGAVRAPSETAAELEARIAAEHEVLAPPADALTRVYEHVRYGGRAPSSDDVRRAEELVARVRSALDMDSDEPRSSTRSKRRDKPTS